MNDYESVLDEYQVLQYIIKNQLSNMTFLLDKTNSFKNGIILIEKNLKSIQGNSEEFDFINPVFSNYIKDMHIYTEIYNGQISIPIQQFIESFTFATNISVNTFNEIKNSFSENKPKVIKARDDYYKYIKTHNNLENKQDDNNELFKAKKENYAQLYKYEIDKMNEIITQNNQKYIDIYKDLNSINFSANSITKNILNKFIKSIADIGNIFIKFSEQLKESIELNIKNIENKIRYSPQIDELTQMRFNLEKFEEYDEKKVKLKNGKIIINEKNKNNLFSSIKLEKSKSLPKKGFEDFEIIDSPIVIMDQKKIKEKTDKLDNFIKKFPTENELVPSEISELMNILKEEAFENDESFSYIFLNNLKKFFKNRVISFNNRQNFIHLSNIMNNICIKEDTTKTFNAIIQVSQMIRYKNLFLYSMIQRKNHFFSTKTFWLKIIQDNLITNINNYADQLLINQNTKVEKKSKREKLKEITKKIGKIIESKEKLNILVKIGLDKEIINFNKLNDEKKNQLDQYGFETICLILSKSLSGMSSFLVPEFISIDIIKHYAKLFDFQPKTISYFYNILETRNIKNSLSQKKNSESSIQKKVQYDKLFIISSTLKYLEQKDFYNLLHLSKNLSPLIKKSIFKFLLSNETLTIEKRISLWGIILKINDAKKLLNYKDVKKMMKERIDKGEIDPDGEEGKNVYTIDVDILRTPYINKDKSHAEKIGWVLKCLNFARPDIGYCQGMNFLALFFYQLLDYNEEETFYFLFALETETKYGEIFIEDLKLLKVYFNVLDKIINLYKPELYYKFIDSYIKTDFYSAPWFITLFTNINCVFEKEKTPKYVLMVLENFLIDGFTSIFISGFTIIRYHVNQIRQLETEELISFMIKDLCEQDIFKNENFNEIKKYYEINSEKINEMLISKLIKITNYENENPYLKKG